jgi:hypothetical protein
VFFLVFRKDLSEAEFVFVLFLNLKLEYRVLRSEFYHKYSKTRFNPAKFPRVNLSVKRMYQSSDLILHYRTKIQRTPNKQFQKIEGPYLLPNRPPKILPKLCILFTLL